MLYEKIRVIIEPKNFLLLKSTNNILRHPKTEIKDIIKLYIYTSSLLISEGYKILKTDYVYGSGDVVKFKPNDIDYLILSKGDKLGDKGIALKVVSDITIKLQNYLESCLLLTSPQYVYFEQFAKNEFTGMKYVFNRASYNSSLFLIYSDSEGNDVEIKEQMGFHKKNKDALIQILKNNSLPTQIESLLLRLRDTSFPKWKKFLINGLVAQFNGENILEDGKYLMELGKEVDIVDANIKKTLEEEGEKKGNKSKDT